MSLDSLDKTCKAAAGLHGCHFGCRRALEQHSPVVNLERSVGPWRSWERASMASRRSWVRTPSAPPFESKELILENHQLLPATVARLPFSSCHQTLIFHAFARKAQVANY